MSYQMTTFVQRVVCAPCCLWTESVRIKIFWKISDLLTITTLKQILSGRECGFHSVAVWIFLEITRTVLLPSILSQLPTNGLLFQFVNSCICHDVDIEMSIKTLCCGGSAILVFTTFGVGGGRGEWQQVLFFFSIFSNINVIGSFSTFLL